MNLGNLRDEHHQSSVFSVALFQMIVLALQISSLWPTLHLRFQFRNRYHYLRLHPLTKQFNPLLGSQVLDFEVGLYV